MEREGAVQNGERIDFGGRPAHNAKNTSLLERLLEAAVDHDGRAASAVAAAVGDGGGAAVEAGGAEAAWFSRIKPCCLSAVGSIGV
jgi:hypothetical protein